MISFLDKRTYACTQFLILLVTVKCLLMSPAIAAESHHNAYQNLIENDVPRWNDDGNDGGGASMQQQQQHYFDSTDIIAVTRTTEANNDDDPICNNVTSHRYDPLACWLWRLKVDVPDQDIKKSFIKVHIRDLVCSNFTVSSIDSAYGPSSSNNSNNKMSSRNVSGDDNANANGNPLIQLTVNGISAACSGSYKISPGYVSGNIYTKATTSDNKPALELTWDIASSEYSPGDDDDDNSNRNSSSKQYRMPKALTTNNCQSNLKVSDLKFTGSISAKVTNIFKGLIEKTVTKQLNGLLCPTLQEGVDPLATDAIAKVDDILIKYLPRGDNSSNGNRTPHIANNYLTSNDKDNDNDNAAQSRLLRSSSTVLSTKKIVDFQKDTPVLMTVLNQVNLFLVCYYNKPGTNNDTAVVEGSCENRITKGLKAIVSAVLSGDLASEVNIPLPDKMHAIRFVVPNYGRVLLDIEDISIAGLGQLQNLSLFSPLTDEEESKVYGFHTSIESGAGAGFNVTANVNITVFPIQGGVIQGDTLNEAFHVHLNTTSLDALANVALALDHKRFQNIPLGYILDSLPGMFGQHPQNSIAERTCLLESVNSFDLSDFAIHTIIESAALVPRLGLRQGRKQSTKVTKQLEYDLDALLNNGLQLVLTEYQPLLTDAVSGLVENPLTDLLNRWIEQNLPSQSLAGHEAITGSTKMTSRLAGVLDAGAAHCSAVDKSVDKDHHELVNFANVTILENLNAYINKPSSLNAVNTVIDQWAANVNKEHSPLFRLGSHLSEMLLPGFSLSLQNVHLDNLGSIDHIDLLSPEKDGMHLKHGFTFGMNKSMAESATIHASVGVEYHPRRLSGVVNVTVNLADLCLDGGSFLLIDITKLRQLTLSHMLSQGRCGLVPLQHKIYNTHNGSRIGSFLANASVSVTGDPSFQNFTTTLDTVEYPSAAALITSILGWAVSTLKDSVNSAVRSSTDQADDYCSAGHTFGFEDDPPILKDGFHDKWLLPILGIFFCIVVGASLIFYYIQNRPSSPASEAEEEVRNASSEELTEPLLPLNHEHDSVGEPDGKDDEVLVHSTAISAFSRHAAIIFVVGTIVLLLSSNMSSGATVDLYVSLNKSESFALPSLFTFSLVNTARDMWDAKIYPLFLLVVILSGIWPYMKLLMMFGSWVSPTSLLSSETRESLLLTLDSLGKFALVDTYLFVLFMVAFRYHADITDQVAIDVYVNPEYGFYSFLVATCFSLLVGHFMIYSHRASMMRHLAPRRDAAHFALRESVLGHNFLTRDTITGEHQKLHFSRLFQVFLLSMAVVATVLLGVGITRKSFKFEIGGIAGDLLGDDCTEYYSLLSLGSSLSKSVRDSGSLGILLLEGTYFFYAVATPFACLGLLMILLVCPMTLTTQRFFLALAEIANAWSAVEVFVISIIASLLEISTFATFIIGNKCDLINDVLKDYFGSAAIDASDATCFTVKSSVEDSATFLVLGVLVNSFIVSCLLRFIHCSVAERTKAETMSSVVPPVNDTLHSAPLPRTIASSWASIGLVRRFVFAGIPSGSAAAPTPVTATTPSRSYIPQSTDTYSVAPDVQWDDATQQNTPQKSEAAETPDEELDMTSSYAVLETMRNAFD